jgi:hypothetical protein
MLASIERIKTFAKNRDISINDAGDNAFWVREGSTIIHIISDKLPNGNEMVSFLSFVVSGARIDDTLLRKLLNLNVEFNFGAFGLSEDGTITYRYSIMGGSHMDEEEFHNALAMVAIIADEYDNKIISTHGGKTAIDKIQDDIRKREQTDILRW